MGARTGTEWKRSYRCNENPVKLLKGWCKATAKLTPPGVSVGLCHFDAPLERPITFDSLRNTLQAAYGNAKLEPTLRA